ncbi:hypothetical protein [Nostoc sp.]|uniref:hypothetical protein n=1 Tax=Nostoc sp. TaxID=1180 RepID=UPI002FFB277E
MEDFPAFLTSSAIAFIITFTQNIFNFYPQLLEQTSENSHPALSANASAAFSVDVEGEERLVIAQEIDRHAFRKFNSKQIAEIIGTIRQTIVMQHLVEVYVRSPF